MKGLVLTAALALTLGGSATQAASVPLAAPVMETAQAAGGEALSAVTSAENHGYLGTLPLPPRFSYQPLPGAAGNLAGLLTVTGKDASVNILAVGWDRSGEKAEADFSGMFLPGGHTKEAGEKMLAFNMGLVNTENVVNDIFLKSLVKVEATTGEHLPYDFVTLDMGHVEQLHRVVSRQDTYTFSAHPAFVVDGWVLPLYVRGLVTDLGNGTYRFLLLTSLDSANAITDRAAEAMLDAYDKK